MPEPSSHPVAAKDPWLRPELVAPWWKIINVMLVMLGIGTVSGALYGTKHSSGDFYQMIGDHFFLRDGFFESTFLALFLFFLHWRGWKSSDLRIHVGWWTSLAGIGLFLLTLAVVYIVVDAAFYLAAFFQNNFLGPFILIFLPTHGVPPGTVIHLHWITILAFTFLNAFYEELAYMGYAFNQWAQKFGAFHAFLFTFALRMGVHIYQGSEHILQIGLWSAIFGLWYWRQGKLWPLILAHALIDFNSLGHLKVSFDPNP